jgi:hypothetical protein
MSGGRCKRRRRWSAAAVALALLLGAGPALAAPADPNATDRRIAELLDLWRCPIAAYFDRIHRAPPTEPHRFLVLWPKQQPSFYVQCKLHDDDSMIYCEAASGVYASADHVPDFALPQRRAVLAGLGFSSAEIEEGNFALDGPYRGADAAATLMIETLGRAYGLDPDDVLDYDAPLLTDKRLNPVTAHGECLRLSAL